MSWKNKMNRMERVIREITHRRGLLLMSAAALALTAIAGAALAYWTDHIEASASVGTLDLEIRYGEEGLPLPEGISMLPGDVVPIRFLVKNSGQVSSDVKPVVRLHTEKPMRLNGSCYQLVTEDGSSSDPNYEVSYRNGATEVSDPSNEAFDTVCYTARQAVTLVGSVQNDTVLDRDESSGQLLAEQAYTCYLKLNEHTGNEFMGTRLDLQVDTYAIQHRNTEGIRKTDDWVATASTADALQS